VLPPAEHVHVTSLCVVEIQNVENLECGGSADPPAEGAVWYADVPNRRAVRVREGGTVLDAVEVDRGCFACMLGGPDGRTLFLLAAEWAGPEAVEARLRRGTGRVYAVDVSVPGAGWP
jgi:sugar lactone lactonase YvrE